MKLDYMRCYGRVMRMEKERIPKRMGGDEVYSKKTAKKTNKEIGGADNSKLAHFEEINRQLESTRFDLSTRNAELQEKVVHLQELTARLQSRNSELELGLEEKATADKGDVGQLAEQLDAANKQLIKVKAQHAGKIKNLKKQLDSLKKVSDANEEITRLQNKVAELEEDKGNLQLHLVDFDELKVRKATGHYLTPHFPSMPLQFRLGFTADGTVEDPTNLWVENYTYLHKITKLKGNYCGCVESTFSIRID
uniref:Uncharacterized protein n=1 Tax=Timema poppense TaxID=170557 RepID=A0A7R9CKN2_TIMPO|nr:unnamed protein product [Timema poppensis]